MRKKRQHFLLLELLVAITLLATFGLYLMQPSFKVMKEQERYMAKLQLGRYSQEALLKVKMLMLERKIVPPNEGTPLSGNLSAVLCKTTTAEKSYQCSYTLHRKKSSKKTSKRKGHIYTLDLTFKRSDPNDSELFSYPIYIEEESA